MYLKEHSPVLLNRLVLNGTLFQHLTEIDRAAQERLDQMIPQMMQEQGVTEDLKRRDQLAWVGAMNSIHAQIEEIILTELVYA